jgi:molybdate transport system permease protein
MYSDGTRQSGSFHSRIMARVLLVMALCAGSAAAADTPKLTAFTAASATDAMKELAAQFQMQTGIHVDLGFGPTSTLARQIEAGAQADIFVSANAQWMNYLQERGLLVPQTRRTLAGNRLVLIVPSASVLSLELDGRTDLASQIEGRIAMGDPSHVPAGQYAKTALEHLGCYETLRPRIVDCTSVREALTLVESGQVAAGIVYRSDAWISDRVRIAGVFPEQSHDPIEFQIALLRDARPGAAELLGYLTSPKARRTLASYGFETGDTTDAMARPRADSQGHRWLPTVEEWAVIRTSLKVAAGCVLFLTIPGILLAYLLARRDFRGKIVLEALVHAPLVVPPVVTGYMLLVLLGNNGLVGRWLHQVFGLELAFTLYGAVLASAVMALPLLVRSVRVAMELCDRRFEVAAATLGAGPVWTFMTVTVPLALPGIVSGMILAFARSLGEFGATAVFVGNIEGRGRTLPLAIYSHLQTASGGDSVVRLVTFSIVLSLLAVGLSEVVVRKAGQRARSSHAT